MARPLDPDDLKALVTEITAARSAHTALGHYALLDPSHTTFATLSLKPHPVGGGGEVELIESANRTLRALADQEPEVAVVEFSTVIAPAPDASAAWAEVTEVVLDAPLTEAATSGLAARLGSTFTARTGFCGLCLGSQSEGTRALALALWDRPPDSEQREGAKSIEWARAATRSVSVSSFRVLAAARFA